MIGFMPDIYPDELVYSWFSRYYVHSGHSAYMFAIEDLLGKKSIRPDVEFVNRMDNDVRTIITKVMPMEELILQHTMFPYYRFAENARLCSALRSMSACRGEDVHRLLPISKKRNIRYIRYCPLCETEAREIHGEAYWTRSSVMKNIGICDKHRCMLKNTKIEISGRQSGRLYVAEEEVSDMVPEMIVDGLELKFAEYMLEVFRQPIDFKNSIPVGVFFQSRLEGTKYLSVRGMQNHISLLLSDLMEFYNGLQVQDDQSVGISQIHQLQHILQGKNSDFYQICQLAYFLGISPDELTNPKLPSKTQTELYNAKVRQLYSQGLGCYRIAREVGGCPSTVRHANTVRKKKPHDYTAARLGKQIRDWKQYDTDMLSEVQKAIEQIYNGNGGRPKRVTVSAVAKYIGCSNKRIECHMPKCKKLVDSYHEDFPVYWAREVVWCYQYLQESKGGDDIRWRDIRDITNLRKNNFLASFEYLDRFADRETAEQIKGLV